MAANIFSFEPNVPRVSSPWARVSHASLDPDGDRVVQDGQAQRQIKLEAEPQTGPVEYKLHLLMRTRRTYKSTRILEPYKSRPETTRPPHPPPRAATATTATAAPPPSPSGGTTTAQSRQHRLEQLTTQLLWRLQQSSSHHASCASNVILPTFPDAAAELYVPPSPCKPPPGISESQGALYEIGVSDDGTFEGLAEDEMQESLNNLRAMAACLGCLVDVTRSIVVGHAEWIEEVGYDAASSRLLVVEALVRPALSSSDSNPPSSFADELAMSSATEKPVLDATSIRLRVSLTGSTLSGKSSLLGTLSTSTLDDARGKSRLTMLKHRHEITSGVTSSVVQEIVGYRYTSAGDVSVVNYAAEDVESWTDIHHATDNGRLVIVSDTAGHPRYRRTTVKGLVGWAPHWTLLCVSANDHDSVLSSPIANASEGLSGAHAHDITMSVLQLCLRLDLPLVIVITKLDSASKAGLRSILAPLLSILKTALRRPVIVPDQSETGSLAHLDTIASEDLSKMKSIFESVETDPLMIVPIIMTSAVRGTGIENLHALLHELPIPLHMTKLDHSHDGAVSASVFHVEDVYVKADDLALNIVAGYLERGHISVHDEMYLGPCVVTVDELENSSDSPHNEVRTSKTTQEARIKPLTPVSSSRDGCDQSQWLAVRVSSLRDCRLPVDRLYNDQVGTIGLEMLPRNTSEPPMSWPRLRKGMVLLSTPVKVSSSFSAIFSRQDLGQLAVGNQVIVYIASIRAAARIVSAALPDRIEGDLGDFGRDSGSERDGHDSDKKHESLIVAFAFDTTREYLEIGKKVLVMPGGMPAPHTPTGPGQTSSDLLSTAPSVSISSSVSVAVPSPTAAEYIRDRGSAGLEGFVGRIVET